MSRLAGHAALADALAHLARDQGAADPRVRGADWRLATVATVSGSGLVTTSDGITARRMESYGLPAVGDLIVVTRSSIGNWVAWGRLRDSADTTTSGASAAAGFSLHEWSARRVGEQCYMRIAVQRTGSVISVPNDGQIADLTLATIPAGWRPIEPNIEAIASDGYGDGGAQITSGGSVVLRTWSSNGQIGDSNNTRTIRITTSYILA